MDGRHSHRRIADLNRIILSRPDIDTLTRHAEDRMPNEACAMLLGRADCVRRLFLTENTDMSPSARFTVSPEQLLEAYMAADAAGLEVVGIFHSHPVSEAYPSETDRRFMQVNPVAWIIYSGANRDLRGYVLEQDGSAREIRIVCQDSEP